MRIQLIHPPVYVNPGALTALRPAPPLGLAYVAAALREAGHACTVLDAVALAPRQTTREGRVLRLGLATEQILERVDPEARVLGVTNMWSFSWPAVRDLIHALRQRFPDKTIVCGGEHFTGLAEYSMRAAPIDYIVLGEGEQVAVELIGRLDSAAPFDPSEVAGICWRRGDEIVTNPRASRNRAVDEIPWPAWDLFDLFAYDENRFVTGIRYGMTVPILATRGCPYQCTFCSSPQMWTTRWFARDPVDVADEIEHYVKEYGATNFPFQDLTAIIKRDWIVAFSKELIRRELNVTWQLPVGTRCEVVDEEVAKLFARSGGRSMCFAPESGSERMRKLVKKRLKTESLMRAVDASTAAKLNISALLIVGFPQDTAEDIGHTVRLVRKLARRGVHDIAVAFFFPIPSTALYDDLIETGRLRLDDDMLMTPIFVHDKYLTEDRNYCENLSARRLTLLKYWIVANFYVTSFVCHPGRIFRLIRNLVRGDEESKMDTFLAETKRRILAALGIRKHKTKDLPRTV
jgi:radical SAM superfamily enzyme YgiQ (UPF0313 family)